MCTNGRTLTRREMIKLLGSAAAATAVAACSAPPPEAAPAPAATAAAQPTAAPKAAAASKEMVMWGLKYDPHITRYKALIKAFGDKTGEIGRASCRERV